MYEQTGGMGGFIAPATTAVITLPLTGGNLLVQIAIAIAAGLTVWGILNARQRKLQKAQ
ncbi:MAG TPA: hypothetical protein VLF60_02740 [Candidatus Saccharimonadales bacterium]|nr:hypothetical protein [Candidatus Saccharimonadales bacterium]